MKDNPGPNYEPIKIGTRLGIDGVKFSMGIKLDAVESKPLLSFNFCRR
jgi:hypothetical protein